ncbi:solute carrier family 35 member F2-like isoform X2 [Tachypleus tridentatus]|uniref:solute carrier family 35 member F2-like isoform X2 n=1 Tax=Tachypleus tridentatus TaxID=6853 RepID=UPI003FD27E21
MDGDIQRDYDGTSLSSKGDHPSVSSRKESSTLSQKFGGYLSELRRWEIWRSIIIGQIVSALVSGTGVSCMFLQSVHKIQAPTAQSFLTYVLLCTVFTTWLACRSGEQGLIPVLRNRGWKYFLVAAADVEANFLLVKAYQYTSLTSVQLLDCFTIPVVLALSWILLKVRYKIVHILGVGVALLGVGCLVWADLEEDKTSQIASNRLLGDMLCLTGAALYGVSNIAEEFVVKTYNRVEFLGMLGLFGSVVNGIQLAILERTELAVINWEEWEEVSFLLGYTMCLFFLYVTLPIVIKNASAIAANLSLLTADCYSLLIGIYIFNNQHSQYSTCGPIKAFYSRRDHISSEASKVLFIQYFFQIIDHLSLVLTCQQRVRLSYRF